MLSIGHFFTGVTVTSGLLLLSGLSGGVTHDGMIAMAGGLVAMLPDIHQIAPNGSTLKEKLYGFHNSYWANLCFGHRIIDQLDTGDAYKYAAIPIATGVATSTALVIKEGAL